ncbi:MAG: hypothetical protein EOM68_10965 [Spirochaetia bacterium]|nr:hypothetical protein [Spirochaetia bacterium]
MEFITLDAQDYETALKEARTAYGTSVRVHTRNDYQIKKGMKKMRRCTITFYLVKERVADDEQIDSMGNEAFPAGSITSVPIGPKDAEILDLSETEREETENSREDFERTPKAKHLDTPIGDEKHQHQVLKDLLEENDFTDGYIQEASAKLLTDMQFTTLEELEMALLEHIIESVAINHSQYTKPKHFFVLLGPTGVGKTTTLVKMAMFYLKNRYERPEEKVALLSLDSYRTGATNQIELFARDFGLDLFHAHTEEELSELLPILNTYSLVLVDTMGKSANQGELSLHLKSLLMVLPQERSSYALAVSASHKNRDLERFVTLFSSYPLESLVVTKLDETEDIGNIISVSKNNNLPLLFFTNGQKVPDNLLKATNEVILSYLRGFALDLQAMGQNQSQNRNSR